MKPETVDADTGLIVEPECLVVIEAGDHRWDRARKLRDELKRAFLRSIDAQVMLGGELLALKKQLGFSGSGRRKEKGHRAPFPESHRTWEELCQAEIGLSERTVQRFIACFKLIEDQARKLGDDSPACQLLGTPAHELADADYKVVSQVLHDLIGERSQAELLRDFNLLRRPKSLTGGDTTASRKANLAKMSPELASNLWRGAWDDLAKGTARILQFRRRKDLDMWLYLIPLVSSNPEVIGLVEYRGKLATILAEAKDDIEAILKKIDGFIDAKQESANAPVKRIRQKKQPTKRKS